MGTAYKKIRPVVLGLILLAASGCRKASEPLPPEPKADNAFTQHIDRAHATMDKASESVDQINARLKAQEQQVQELQ